MTDLHDSLNSNWNRLTLDEAITLLREVACEVETVTGEQFVQVMEKAVTISVVSLEAKQVEGSNSKSNGKQRSELNPTFGILRYLTRPSEMFAAQLN